MGTGLGLDLVQVRTKDLCASISKLEDGHILPSIREDSHDQLPFLSDFCSQGTDGWPAPLLKDVELPEEKWRELYPQCVRMMRVMFQHAKLVHADLSEFNMLYHEGKIFFIDVSQVLWV